MAIGVKSREGAEVLLFETRRPVEIQHPIDTNISKSEVQNIRDRLSKMKEHKPNRDELHDFNTEWINLAKRLYARGTFGSKRYIRNINKEIESISKTHKIATHTHYITRDGEGKLRIADHKGNEVYSQRAEEIRVFVENNELLREWRKGAEESETHTLRREGNVTVSGKNYEIAYRYSHELKDGDLMGRSLDFPDYKEGLEMTFGPKMRELLEKFQNYADGTAGADRLNKLVTFVFEEIKYIDPKDPSMSRIKTLDEVVEKGDVCAGKTAVFISLMNHDPDLSSKFNQPRFVAGTFKVHPEEKNVAVHHWSILPIADGVYAIIDVTHDIFQLATNPIEATVSVQETLSNGETVITNARYTAWQGIVLHLSQ